MTEAIWSIPTHRVDAETARRTILVQHERIRALLVHAREIAERALDQAPQRPDAVASAIGDIHTTLETHLRFEEKVLVEIWKDDLPVGPIRATRLQEDHVRQRATLADLHAEARAHPEMPLLAAKLAFLTSWLLEDMEEEERTILTPDSVRDDVVVVDQSDG
ncbi:MAG TPA: hemerythrin domain-containing protein [Polyangia bacterium]|nr:hemerythrin domain-containing protein [Polyangia bacterium]